MNYSHAYYKQKLCVKIYLLRNQKQNILSGFPSVRHTQFILENSKDHIKDKRSQYMAQVLHFHFQKKKIQQKKKVIDGPFGSELTVIGNNAIQK